jgi:hydrogenase maturation protease
VTDPDPGRRRAVVIGVGNQLRGDDAVGLEVARRVRRVAERAGAEVREESGERLRRLDAWDGRDAAFVVDAMRSSATPGAVRRLDASDAPLDAAVGGAASTHAVALADAIERARALGRLPPRVIVYAIEGADFTPGGAISTPVVAAVTTAAAAVMGELDAPATRRLVERH